MAGVAVGHSAAYSGAGTYKGAGPSSTAVKAVGHSLQYRGPGTYVAFNPNAAPAVNYSSPLYDPTKVLSGKDLATSAQAIADAQTKGPMAELAAQIAQNNTQAAAAQKQSAGYFNQLGQFVNQGNAQLGTIGTNLNNSLAGLELQTAGGIANAFKPSASLSTMAANGLGGGGDTTLAQDAARQQGFGLQNATAYRAAGATQGANYQSLGASNLGTYGLKGQETLGKIAQSANLKNTPLTSKEAALTAQNGSLYATALGKLRTDERNYILSNAGLGVKQNIAAANNATSTANNQRTNATSAANNQRTVAQSAANNAANNATSRANNAANNAAKQAAINAKGAAGSRPLTQSEQNKLYNVIDTMPALIKSMQQPLNAAQAKGLGLPVGTKLSAAQIKSALGTKYNPLYIEVGYEMAGWGHILPGTAQKLYAMGLRGPHYKVGPDPPKIGQTIGNVGIP